MQKNSDKIFNYFSSGSFGIYNLLDAYDFDLSVWNTGSDCLRAAVLYGSIYFPVFFPAAVTLDVTLMAIEEGLDPSCRTIDLAKVQNACTPVIKQAASSLWHLIIGNATNPK